MRETKWNAEFHSELDKEEDDDDVDDEIKRVVGVPFHSVKMAHVI